MIATSKVPPPKSAVNATPSQLFIDHRGGRFLEKGDVSEASGSARSTGPL